MLEVEHFKKLAAITRNVARDTIDPGDKQKLLDLAEYYEGRAQRRLDLLAGQKD